MPRFFLGLLTTATSLCLLLETAAWAQVTGEQAVAAAQASKMQLPPDSLAGELVFRRIAEDYFVSLAMRINFDREDWGVGFQLPLNFRIIDNDPKESPPDYLGALHLRREDWNDWGKFLRLVRYVYLGQADKKGPFYVRVGELDALTVGHGTIMYRYFNNLWDVSNWHTGINAAVNIGAFGGEAMLNDVAHPYIAGMRFTVRPLELAIGEGWLWDKLVLGTTVMTDWKAPTSLQLNDAGLIVADALNQPAVASERRLVIAGLDSGIEVFSNELISITPYADLNKMVNVAQHGWGFHTGILWQLHFPVVIDTLTLDARTEYRRVSGDYIGPYFDSTYEIDRYQATNVGTSAQGVGMPAMMATLGQPKLATLLDGGASRNGMFFSLLAGLPQFVFVGGDYTAYDGNRNDGTLRLMLDVPALTIFKFSAFYYRVNISGLSDLFSYKDNRSAIVATASIPIYGFLSLNVRWWRLWQLQPDGYHSVDDWSVGVGFNLTL
jgi:hypothetical protein